jgi:hypothetical protein
VRGIERKIKFIENIIGDYQSKILLATIDNEIMDGCFIVSGLQRLTALQYCFDDKFNIWYKDLANLKRKLFRL